MTLSYEFQCMYILCLYAYMHLVCVYTCVHICYILYSPSSGPTSPDCSGGTDPVYDDPITAMDTSQSVK